MRNRLGAQGSYFRRSKHNEKAKSVVDHLGRDTVAELFLHQAANIASTCIHSVKPDDAISEAVGKYTFPPFDHHRIKCRVAVARHGDIQLAKRTNQANQVSEKSELCTYLDRWLLRRLQSNALYRLYKHPPHPQELH